MTQKSPAVVAFAGVSEAALALGHRTYSGTVASTTRHANPAPEFTSVAAAHSLGHRTYSGTVAATERLA